MKKASPKGFTSGFTLLELLTVMAIIIVLAGMILGGVGYAQKRAAMDRARGEIAALSVALESYKVDNGDYPRDDNTDTLVPINTTNGQMAAPSNYVTSGVTVLALLEGRATGDIEATNRRYFEPKLDMISTGADRYLIDPFGNAYGYSTAKTFNPTFDLWSTVGLTNNPSGTNATNPADRTWITNW